MTSFLEYTIALQAKLAVFAIFTILLISSCSDPAAVGLELAPGNNQIGVFYQEFSLDAQQVLLDSFTTVNTGILVAGNETDDFFGKTESAGYSRMYIDATKDLPTTGAILDSMFFNLNVVSVNGSDLDKPKRLRVHKLTEPILDTIYYNFDAISHESIPFAGIDFTFGEVKDTLLRLPVAENFENEFFGAMVDGKAFSTLVNFRNYFPGFAIKASEGDNSTIGSALGGGTGISVYYHYGTDTVSLRYDVTTFSSRNFNGIKSDRSGTPTEVVTEYGKSYDVGPTVGMKSGMAMAMRIDTSPLDAFLDTLSGVIFNQVNFTIGAIQDQDEDNNPITGMVMIFVDNDNNPVPSTLNNSALYVQSDGQPQVLLDENGDKVPNNSYASSAVLDYSLTDKDYLAGITSHLNAIYRGDLIRQNWLLYGSFPTPQASGDNFKKSLRQFKVDKSKVIVKIIYSKSR